MIIKSLSGKKIYQSEQITVRGTLEEGVARGVDFSFADLRQARLARASLDGIVAVGATFWGADLDGADIGLSDLRKVDMRCASLKDTCLAETDLTDSDLRGAYFSQTIIEGAVLDKIRVSCPSFWELDLGGARSVKGAVFCHKGEEEIAIDPARWIIQGFDTPIVLNDAACFWRGRLYRAPLPVSLRHVLGGLQATVEKALAVDHSHTAKAPNPKRVNSAKRI